jgi:hypothetical protein
VGSSGAGVLPVAVPDPPVRRKTRSGASLWFGNLLRCARLILSSASPVIAATSSALKTCVSSGGSVTDQRCPTNGSRKRLALWRTKGRPPALEGGRGGRPVRSHRFFSQVAAAPSRARGRAWLNRVLADPIPGVAKGSDLEDRLEDDRLVAERRRPDYRPVACLLFRRSRLEDHGLFFTPANTTHGTAAPYQDTDWELVASPSNLHLSVWEAEPQDRRIQAALVSHRP